MVWLMDEMIEGFAFTHHTQLAPRALLHRFQPLLEVAHFGIKQIVARLELVAFHALDLDHEPQPRSEEHRSGQECVSTCKYRWSMDHTKTRQVCKEVGDT